MESEMDFLKWFDEFESELKVAEKNVSSFHEIVSDI